MIDVLMGHHEYADIVLQGGYIINVITREIYLADLAMKGEFILLIGDCSTIIGEKTRVYDVRGHYISPGFIDSHMHFESSMLTCTEFSKLSILSGTTTLIADPHEIGNVLGINGVKAMIEESKHLANRVLFTIPALAPDVPGLETAGVTIESKDIKDLLTDCNVQGLGEMQGFSNAKAVYEHTPWLIDDLLTSVYYAKKNSRTVEGNAPGLTEKDLAAHIILCGNETSCHETTTKEECIEKIRNGVTVFMREGSTQRNMSQCIKAVTEEGLDSRKLVLVTDDMVAEDLIQYGHMNDVIRRTIKEGIDPVEAIQMATINPAYHFGLKDIGVLAPGKVADICVISNLMEMQVAMVFVGGALASKGKELLLEIPSYTYPVSVKNSMRRKKVTIEELVIPSNKLQEQIRGIQVIVDQNLTGCVEDSLPVTEGHIAASTEKDILPLLSIERHGISKRIGKTFVKGMGLKYGAIAQSIGHDTHNLLVCGVSYEDMTTAANRVIAMGGGIAMVKDGKVVADLPLPVAGLITDELTGTEVCERINILDKLAETELKCSIHSPFMHLSFLSLVTSAKWKISDYGLIDAETYDIIDTVVGSR
jgi:adenine deaminase